MPNETRYRVRVVRGSFVGPQILDRLGAKTIESLGRDEWVSIDEVVVSLEEIKMLQKEMTRHYDDKTIPWYMDGYEEGDKNKLIVAFGTDDGEGGKIFTLDGDDAKSIEEVANYGISKGIPKEQMGFYEIGF